MQIERSGTVTEVAKDLPYIIVKDGYGIEFKVVDFDKHPLPKHGVMVFESVKKNTRTPVQNYIYRCTKDEFSEVMVGICTGVNNRTKDLRWQPITLTGLNTFDLSVPSERKKAIVLLHSSIVLESPNLSKNTAVHLFRVHDAEKAANLQIKRISDARRSIDIAMALHGEELLDMARNLGIMTESTSLMILTSEVLKRAEQDPSGFLTIYDNPNRELVTILNRCLNTGIVTFDSLDGYHYDGRFLGHNEPAVYEFLRKYPDVAGALGMKSKAKLKDSEKAMAAQEPVKTTNDAEVELAILRKRLEEAEAKLEKQSAGSIQESLDAEEEADPILVNELESLKEEAKKIAKETGNGNMAKGLHHFKPTRDSIDKLKEKIEKGQPA